MIAPNTLQNPLPAPPRLVLRVGLAGNRDVPEAARQRLLDTLADVFRTTARRLADVAPGTPMRVGQEPRFSRFYSQQAPLLRLIRGKSGVRGEIRCQYIILARKDEPTLDYAHGSSVSPRSSRLLKSGVSTSFLPEKMNRHWITPTGRRSARDRRDFSSKPTASEGLNGLDLRQETENGPSQRL